MWEKVDSLGCGTCSSVCGDGTCDADESYCSCPADCTTLPLSTTWNTGMESWTSQGNWALNSSQTYWTDQCQYFNWSPNVLNYSHALTSPSFDLNGCSSATLNFEFVFDDYLGDAVNYLVAECSPDGANWYQLWLWDEYYDGERLTATPVSVALNSNCVNDSNVRVRFRAIGNDSYEIMVLVYK